MKAPLRKFLLVVYLASVLLMHAVLAWNVRKLIAAGAPDFAIYYCAGTVVRQGFGHQLYDPSVRFQVEQQFADVVPQFRGPLPYTHPPFEALIFAPFTYLPYGEAYVVWNLFNALLLAALPFLLRPHLPQLQSCSPLLWMLPSLAFFPVFFAFLEAQDAILLLFVYALAFLSLKRNRFAAAGAWLALGLFKYHLVLPFVLLWLVQKRRAGERTKLLSGFLPVAALLVLVSLAIAGTRALTTYPYYVLHVEDALAGSPKVPEGMPNLRGLAYIFLPPGSYIVPLLALLSLALLVFTAWKCRQPGPFDLQFSLALVTTVLVSYHVVSYDLSMLLLPVALLANFLLAETRLRRGPAVLVVFGIATLFFPPLQLYLSLRHKQYALMALVLLVWMVGIAGELSARARREADLEQMSATG
ncbi:MAG: DUF2029 domain-containing protein [Acidobacteriia bacterium]|nr:DUF2029 domain-containing protein [Terriglobia bacterium]